MNLIQAIRNLLNALGNVDSGTECVLNYDAFQAICDLLNSVYGHKVVHQFEQACTRIEEDGVVSYTLTVENFGSEFDQQLAK